MSGPWPPSAEQRLALLQTTELFRGFDASELAPLLPGIRAQELRRGGYFYRLGEDPHSVYLLIAGQATMNIPTPNGEEVVLDIVVPGQIFGLPGVFSDARHRVAETVATEPCLALEIQREVFIAFLDRHRSAMHHVLARLAQLVREYSELITELASEDLRERVARRLLALAGSYGQDVHGATRLAFKVPQATLAGMVGASRSKVNRVLADLVADGYIDLGDGVVTVSNAAGLVAAYPAWLHPGGRPPASRGA